MIDFIKRIISKFNVSRKGVCMICDQEFLDHELIQSENLFLCRKHYDHLKNHDWYLLDEGLSNPEDPSAALKLQDKKDELKQQNICSYITTEYIQEGEHIVTRFKLYREREK